MTTPTQAQIDAAARAMEQEMFAPHELPLDDELHGKYLHTAKAALTAAAEVGYSEPQGIGFQTGEPEPSAAEAGGFVYTQSQLDGVVKQTWAATIERCAQVAIDWRGWLSGNREPTPEEIATAIRALKDK